MTWVDDGVSLKVEVSTSGSFIEPPQRTDYMFVQNNAVNPPVGWTRSTIGTPQNAYWGVGTTTDNMTWMQSNALNNIPTAQMYIDNSGFPLVNGHRYQVVVSVRGRTPNTGSSGGDTARGSTTSPILVLGPIKSGQSNPYTFFTFEPFRDAGMPDSANWYTLVGSLDATATDGVPVTGLRISLGARAPRGSDNTTQWGADFRDLTIIDVTTGTATNLTWREVTCDTMNANVRYGRERFTERYDVATMTVKLNNVSGDYIYHPDPAENWGFRPGRMFRMIATYNGTTYPFCYGVIDRIGTEMTLDGKANVTLTVFDTTSFASDIPTPYLGVGSYAVFNDPRLLSGNRVNALLDYAGISTGVRQIDPGIFSMQNVDGSGRAIREEIGVTADSEGGAFYGERDGTLVYKDRSWVNRDPRGGTVQANITAYPHDLIIDQYPDSVPTAPGAPTVCPFAMETDWSLERVINTITLSVAGGTRQFYSNALSQTSYGQRTYQRLDFVNYSGPAGTATNQLTARANDIFSTSLESLLRVQRLEFRPTEDTWDWSLQVFMNWLIRVFYYSRDGEWGFATVVRVQSIEHRITPHDWVVALDLDQPITYSGDLTPERPGGWDLQDWDAAVWDDERTAGAIWSAGMRWSNPESKWGE